MNKIKEYISQADPKDLQDCLLENLEKHSKRHFNMLSELYYNDRAHFDQLSLGCKAAAMLYLSFVMGKEYVQEGIEEFMESL